MAKSFSGMPGKWYLGKGCKIEEGKWTGKPEDLYYVCRSGDKEWTDVTKEAIDALEASNARPAPAATQKRNTPMLW